MLWRPGDQVLTKIGGKLKQRTITQSWVESDSTGMPITHYVDGDGVHFTGDDITEDMADLAEILKNAEDEKA